jgi:iron complex outermembrane receptor protein
LLTAVLCSVVAPPSEAVDLWPVLLDTVEVVETRPFPEEALGWHRGFVQVVPLGPSTSAMTDLGRILDHVAGVQVRRTGGLGAVTLAAVRGTGPAQVQVFLDDTPISTAPDAVANLALIPLEQFSRLEVARGPTGLGSSGGAAGVLRLVADDRADIRPRLRMGIGSYGARSASGLWGLRRGGTSVLVVAGRTESKGDYPYRDRNGTPWEGSDDRTVRRSNNAFHQEDVLLQLRTRRGGWSIESTSHGLWKDAGLPGTENLQTRNVHDRFQRRLQGLNLRLERDRATFGLSGRFQEDQDRFRNPDGEIGLGTANRKDRARTVGGEARAAIHRLKGRITLAGTGAATRESWASEDRARQETNASRQRAIFAGTIEGRFEPAGPAFTVLAGLREVASRGDLGAVQNPLPLPHAGFVWEVGRHASVRGGWGASARLPSLVELFGQGGVQVGNPDLVAERTEGWDLGGTLLWGAQGPLRGQIEAAVFGNRTRDAILWLQNSQQTHRAQNIDRAEVLGLETLVRLAPRGAPLDAVLTATYQDARDRGPLPAYRGKKLPYLPDFHSSAELRATLGAFEIAYLADHESGAYRDRYNTEEKHRGARTLQDVELRRAWPGGLVETSLAVRNVADHRANDIDGFPLPGRSLQLELTVNLAAIASGASSRREAGQPDTGDLP